MQFAVKKPASTFWKPGYSEQKIRDKLESGKITEQWLICPQGHAEQAVQIADFLKNPSILLPVSSLSRLPHKPLIFTTSDSLPGETLKEIKGIAFGEVVVSTGIFRGLSFPEALFGGRAEKLEETIREARKLAIEEMIAEAHHLGADAVISVQVDYESDPLTGTVMICAKGTAVAIEKKTEQDL